MVDKKLQNDAKKGWLNIFKVSYVWYEGEHGDTLLGKGVSDEEFEEDLVEARKFAESLIGVEIKDYDYLGKGYSVECLPRYYDQIIWFLTEKKGYAECYTNEYVNYFVEDDLGKTISIDKTTKRVESKRITGA